TRLDAKGLMTVAAILADGLETGLQSIDVFGTVLHRFDVGSELRDCRFEVVHFLPDRRSCGCLVAGFRTIWEQRRHLRGIVSKGCVDFPHFGHIEGPLALYHLRANLCLGAALLHQSLTLVDDVWAALRRSRSHAEH